MYFSLHFYNLDYYIPDLEYVYDRYDQKYNSSVEGVQCDCQQTPYCIQQAIVYDLDAITPLFPIPGMYLCLWC